MFRSIFITTFTATAILLTACATPHVVQAVKTSDIGLTCAQLDTEIAEADRFRSDAQKEKGMTGTNVAAVILFWPAMIGTYSNANEAISAADTRKSNLVNLYSQKKCTERNQESDAIGTVTVGKSEKKLAELKVMLDKGLITKVEHDAKRQQILSSM